VKPHLYGLVLLLVAVTLQPVRGSNRRPRQNRRVRNRRLLLLLPHPGSSPRERRSGSTSWSPGTRTIRS
jgi:hypothetical protein